MNEHDLQRAIDTDTAPWASMELQGRTAPAETWDTEPADKNDALVAALLAGAYGEPVTDPVILQAAMDGKFTDEDIAELERQRQY